MKVWKKVKFLKKDKNINIVSQSYINYILKDSPMNDLVRKYHIDPMDLVKLNTYLANRIAGLLVLYMAKDNKRLNDIILKYQTDHLLIGEIIPEIEGYIEK